MAIKFGKGRAEVEITGALADGLERELLAALGPVGDELMRTADRILRDEILPNWPVASGKSRDAWRKSLRVQPGEFRVEVVLSNPFEWTRYLKSTKVGEKDNATRLRSPLVKHVREPARASEAALKTAIPEIIARALNGEVPRGR